MISISAQKRFEATAWSPGMTKFISFRLRESEPMHETDVTVQLGNH